MTPAHLTAPTMLSQTTGPMSAPPSLSPSHPNLQLLPGEAEEDNPTTTEGDAAGSCTQEPYRSLQKLDQGGECWRRDCDGTCQCLGATSLPVMAELPMAISFPHLSTKTPAVTSLSRLGDGHREVWQ